MSARALFFLVFNLSGGLALFIFGMNIMTDGLRKALGAKLQQLLSKTTRNKYAGFGLGTTLGAVIHSAPTVVMLMGFVNAGLMTLEQTIAPMLGANVGTTLSMQAVSFHINDYCFVAIAAGLIVSLLLPTPKGKDLGRALLGFGLLFLGMNVMSDSILPHKAMLSHYLQGINGDSYSGLFIGIGVSLLLTSIWQSSGATIAIIFAMVSAGVFTQFSQIYPIVLGAHVGTCITALLGSIGTNIDSKRTAISHLVFNVINVLLAIAAKPLYIYIIQATSSDLTHQTANLHTLVILVPALLILPVAVSFAKLVQIITPSKSAAQESSHLDYTLLEYPERAIMAVINELQRVTKICARSLYLTGHVILHSFDRATISKIKMSEKAVNDIKLALREYLWSMTKKYLSRRQIIMSYELNRCMNDLERVGDHIDQLCDISLKRHKTPDSMVDKESFDGLFSLYEKANNILCLVVDSLKPDQDSFQECAASILNANDEYANLSVLTKENFIKKVERHEVSSVAALYYNEYVTVLDRMINHIHSIALVEKGQDFWIKQSKLDKKPPQIENKTNNSNVDPSEYLDKLRNEEYL